MAETTINQMKHVYPELGQRKDFILRVIELEEAKLKQVDVTLLDVVAELGEIEVIITTEATSKRFAISRQCPSAIFRLDKRAKD